MRAPYAPRGQGDRSDQHTLARSLKEQGITAESTDGIDGNEQSTLWPRLRAQRPRPGYTYAVDLSDIRHVLSFFGERCFYGLRAIELVRGDDAAPETPFRLGRLIVPGRIVLYDHPPSPWILPGRLALHEEESLRQSGALIEVVGEGRHTIISWPGTTLHDFVLFDVLMHEIGHHLIQQYTGKYRARVMRTKDHEATATRFAAQCRRAYAGQQQAP